MQCLAKLNQLALAQIAVVAARHLAELQRTDARPNELQHWIADLLEHPAHNPVAPLVDDDAHNGAVFNVANRSHHLRLRALAIDDDAATKPLQRRRRGMPIQQRLVLFVDHVARVHHAVSDKAVICEQQETFGLAIQPTYRHDALAGLHEIHDRIAPALIGGGRDITARLVQQDVAVSLRRDDFPVDFNLLRRGINPRAELSDHLSIDADAPLNNERLGFSSRCNAGSRNDTLQSFHALPFLPPLGRSLLMQIICRTTLGVYG